MWLPESFENRSAASPPLPFPCATSSRKRTRLAGTSITKRRGSIEGRE